MSATMVLQSHLLRCRRAVHGLMPSAHCLVLVLLLVVPTVPSAAAAERCAVCPSQDKCTFRVLAVGDSLTRGAVPSKSSAHPYSLKMTEVLRDRLASRSTNKANVQVTTAGYDYMGTIQKGQDANGRKLDLTLVPYTQQLLQQAQQAGQSYQYAVVLAGINDLGAGNHSAAAVFPRLVQMYDMLLASGANVVAVPPWPNRFVSRSSDNERQRQLLGQMLQEYVNGQTNSKRSPRVYLMQLPSEWFDFWTMPSNRISQMQDDLLHLTPFGYDMFGQLVADKILSNLSPTECLCPCSNSGSSSGSRAVAASSGSSSGGRRGLGDFWASWRLPFLRRTSP